MTDIKFDIKTLAGRKNQPGQLEWSQSKIDIRDWAPEHEKMGKGITLNKNELKKLKELLEGIDLEALEME